MSPASEIESLLERRQNLTDSLENNPYSIGLRISRADVYNTLGFPDLAVMDAYKALLLIDEVADPDAEYHELAIAAMKDQMSQQADVTKSNDDAGASESEPINLESDGKNGSLYDNDCIQYSETYKLSLLVKMSNLLTQIGCLRHAYDYAQHALRLSPNDPDANACWKNIKESAYTSYAHAKGLPNETEITRNDLPETGSVRREVYPWNHHEADRTSPAALELLNTELYKIAPKLQVRVTELPALHVNSDSSLPAAEAATTTQLGVFAQSDIEPGEEILKERSLLTGNSRLHEPLCDACSTPLPTLQDTPAAAKLVPCTDCSDIIFCSQTCHDLAQAQYHPAVCDTDIEAIAKDVPPSKAADALYTLLLFRALAMAKTQNTHPLDLLEVKYIWGDFTPPPNPVTSPPGIFAASPRTLPFSLDANIITPLHMLEMMDVDIFGGAHSDLSEAWVWNTLYAKFRGTASARISPRDGRPEVAAVHPLWCLANHSCDPNVAWEWAGEVVFTARQARIAWRRRADGAVGAGGSGGRGGIRAGEEILNHYVDIELPVDERREWGAGALGGACMCERCVWESTPGP